MKAVLRAKYLHYCKFQKELDDKSIRAYLIDIHSKYKQKNVKRKIASVKALFHYLEEEEIL